MWNTQYHIFVFVVSKKTLHGIAKSTWWHRRKNNDVRLSSQKQGKERACDQGLKNLMQEWLIDVYKNIIVVGIVYWCPKGCLMQELIGFNSSLIPSCSKKNFFFKCLGTRLVQFHSELSVSLIVRRYSLPENKPMPVFSEFRACHNMSVSQLLVQWRPLIQILFLGGNDKFPNQWCWILWACSSVFVFWNLNSQILKLQHCSL